MYHVFLSYVVIVIVTPRDVAKFLGALEASKKEPYFRFWLVSCSNFKNLYLAKVLFLLQLPKLYYFFVESNKEYLHLLYFCLQVILWFHKIFSNNITENRYFNSPSDILWLHCTICRLTKMQILNSMPMPMEVWLLGTLRNSLEYLLVWYRYFCSPFTVCRPRNCICIAKLYF